MDAWRWPLDAPEGRLHAARELLAGDEVERAERFVRQMHRDRYVEGRARMREILGLETGQHPRDIVFRYGANGKPSIDGGPDFNLSHSDGLAVLVISRDGALGVDVEKRRPIEDCVARHHFAPAECANLSQLSPEDWLEGFYRCWTRKEAVIKACGLGLSMRLESFVVTLIPGQSARLVWIEGDDASAWRLMHFEPAPGWSGAIAARTCGAEIDLKWRDIAW